ncbi:hypothetical protein RvY_07400 [Ramazzottius varieornatus]|uniref:Fas-binding factor 1 C-terminal domain-containing protein n=1 Tax=Ramazzottius varieornatus TaxID=947166 RepID=A0A1D1V211_RAMVA|nr:hypothetical protein RvY_07400 [Ramazzottius varieornatus]
MKANIELDEFDEMAFGLAPAGTNPAGRDNPLDVLNSRDPPPLRVGAQLPSAAPAANLTTKIPLDGIGFSDDDDDLFPAFQPSSRPKTATPVARSSTSILDSLEPEQKTSTIPTSSNVRPSTTPSVTPPVSVFDRLKSEVPAPDPAKQTTPSIFNRLGTTTVPEVRPQTSLPAVPANPTGTALSSKAPVQSTLFRNLTRPPWEKDPATPVASLPGPSVNGGNASVLVQRLQDDPQSANTTLPVTDQAEAERQRRAMMFGGSTGRSVVPPTSTVVPAPTEGDSSVTGSSSLLPKSSELLDKVLTETKNAEEEDLRRVRSHHDFIRQQTQQAVQLQQAQADEFLRQYLAENQKQLNAHLQRLRSGFSLAQPLLANQASGDGMNSVASEEPLAQQRVAVLERKLEEKDALLLQHSKQMLLLEEQHREETRVIRAHYDEALRRTAQIHHEYVLSLLSSHESVRKQYEEALEYLRESTSAKSSLEAVRSTVEQSARDFALWRTELESRHANTIREKESQLCAKDQRINELTEALERQATSSLTEREVLQRRIQEDGARLAKRQLEVEDQAYTLARERTEFEAERTRFHSTQAKELQRLEKRLDEALKEKQEASEYIAQESHALEEGKRKLAETIRQAEEKYALEYKKRELALESEREAVFAEKKLLDDKRRNLVREEMEIKIEREKLERDKHDESMRRTRLDQYNQELMKRDRDLEQTVLRAAKVKREGELALQEAKFLDEEHKTRVAKFNVFLEQLRDKELTLMRQAVESDVDGKQRAVQLPNGALTVIPHRHGRSSRMQILPNPARDDKFWQGEKEYLQVLKSTPWTTERGT